MDSQTATAQDSTSSGKKTSAAGRKAKNTKAIKATKRTKKSQAEATTSASAAAAKTKSNKPTYVQMIVNAIRDLKEAKGSSRYSIQKYIVSTYNLNPKAASIRSNLALRSALEHGIVKHGKSSGLFKVGEKEKSQSRKTVQKVKAPKTVVSAAASETPAAAKPTKKSVRPTKTIVKKLLKAKTAKKKPAAGAKKTATKKAAPKSKALPKAKKATKSKASASKPKSAAAKKSKPAPAKKQKKRA